MSLLVRAREAIAHMATGVPEDSKESVGAAKRERELLGPTCSYSLTCQKSCRRSVAGDDVGVELCSAQPKLVVREARLVLRACGGTRAGLRSRA